jgi:glycosyltransferase involved in cell wall biosynthesis
LTKPYNLKDFPKISFGIIVFNGQPLTKYCLRSIYPFAHEIIVAEGACVKAKEIATRDGHSTDGTLQALQEFKEQEDPECKVKIVTKNGFWSEKDEQSQAYAKIASGDYLWQVDIDEFYKPEDILYVMRMLRNNPEITAVSFKILSFWGSFDYRVDGYSLRQGAAIFYRLFKFGNGYTYVTHRPPTVHDPKGRSMTQLYLVDGYEMARRNIYLYHYSLVFPKQVLDKCEYYKHHEWRQCKTILEWAEKNFMRIENPYRVYITHTHLSWLERYKGTHPLEIYRLMKDIEDKHIKIELRPTEDIERLLRKKSYWLGRLALKVIGFFYNPIAIRAIPILIKLFSYFRRMR